MKQLKSSLRGLWSPGCPDVCVKRPEWHVPVSYIVPDIRECPVKASSGFGLLGRCGPTIWKFGFSKDSKILSSSLCFHSEVSDFIIFIVVTNLAVRECSACGSSAEDG
jgi:hypothetical protein